MERKKQVKKKICISTVCISVTGHKAIVDMYAFLLSLLIPNFLCPQLESVF